MGSGLHFIPPWVVVSHLSRDARSLRCSGQEAPTSDNVRAAVDTSITFMVTDPTGSSTAFELAASTRSFRPPARMLCV